MLKMDKIPDSDNELKINRVIRIIPFHPSPKSKYLTNIIK
jgi:hypothetical protein